MIGRMIDAVQRSGLRPKSLQTCGAMADLVPRHQITEITQLPGARFEGLGWAG